MTGPDKNATMSLTLGEPKPMTLVINAGDKGCVTINMDTGEVTIPPGLQTDEAAALFWKAVGHMGVRLR